MDQPQEITQMLRDWSGGKREALEELMPLVYDELHRQAALFLRRERRDHTIQATALIHETYLKLIDQRVVNWENRAHFFAISASLMRRILVDYARSRNRDKRGGGAIILTLGEVAKYVPVKERSIDLIALDGILQRLEKLDNQQAQIVELRYFGGLSLEETAAALKISRTTVATDWAMAKAWMHRELTK
jgi:RNA polymerase sigma factor (TIGR02999 family)